jgi:cathepsin E
MSLKSIVAGTLSPATGTLIPTVTDNLFGGGTITAHAFGISFEPTTSLDVVNGEISWGKLQEFASILSMAN